MPSAGPRNPPADVGRPLEIVRIDLQHQQQQTQVDRGRRGGPDDEVGEPAIGQHRIAEDLERRQQDPRPARSIGSSRRARRHGGPGSARIVRGRAAAARVATTINTARRARVCAASATISRRQRRRQPGQIHEREGQGQADERREPVPEDQAERRPGQRQRHRDQPGPRTAEPEEQQLSPTERPGEQELDLGRGEDRCLCRPCRARPGGTGPAGSAGGTARSGRDGTSDYMVCPGAVPPTSSGVAPHQVDRRPPS